VAAHALGAQKGVILSILAHNTSSTNNMLEATADADLKPVELNESLYKLDADEKAFFKEQTGIVDDEELKRHIIRVQREAYAVFPYPCIYLFDFTRLVFVSYYNHRMELSERCFRLNIFRLTAYPKVLELGRTRAQPILLDIGCCFGNGLRKAVADGYPANACIGSDLRSEFWDLGYRLFQDSPSTFTASFVGGNALEPTMLAPDAPFPETVVETAMPLDLSTISGKGSLNPLHGRVSVIHASAFFHLFSEEQQARLARALAPLLSPEPGSMLLGSHGGLPKKGIRPDALGGDMFCHSPESWTQLWEDVFGKGKVKVDTNLVEYDRATGRDRLGEVPWLTLEWSVVRLRC
jgi:hypothetical protein